MNSTHHWKLGLFVLSGLMLGLLALFWLGSTRLRVTVPAVTYFDESVQGLEIGSAVKLRGVTIGTVEKISLAPDRRHIRVLCAIYEDCTHEIGLSPQHRLDEDSTLLWPQDLRMSIASGGITGIKFLQVDFVDPRQDPPPPLPFTPEQNYVPSMTSTLKSIEDPLVRAANALPQVLEDMHVTLQQVQQTLTDLKLPELGSDLHLLVQTLDRTLAELKVTELRGDVQSLIRTGGETLQRTDQWIARLQSEDGPIERLAVSIESTLEVLRQEVAKAAVGGISETIRMTSKEIGAAASSINDGALAFRTDASRLAAELETDLVALRETLRSVRLLADLLERDPGALILGRSDAERAGAGGQR